MKIWENKKNWEAIYRFLVNKKIDERKKNLTSYEQSLNFSNINHLGKVVIKNLWKVGKSVMGLSESKQDIASQINEKDLHYYALEEINFHMINLGLKSELTIDSIIELGFQYFIFLIKNLILNKGVK